MKAILLLSVLVLASCHKEIVTKKDCTANCTTMQGSILTTDLVPLVNIPVSVKSFSGNMLVSQTRRIAESSTNSNGSYALNFYLQDKELAADHMLYLDIDLRHLDPKEFLLPKFFGGDVKGSFIGSTLKRDTTINASVYIPKKEYITINLKNYRPIKTNDVFQIEVFSPWGWKAAEKLDRQIGNSILTTAYDILHTGMDGSFVAKAENETFTTIPVARKETNLIRVIKVKNGVASAEEVKLFVPEKNNIELTFNY